MDFIASIIISSMVIIFSFFFFGIIWETLKLFYENLMIWMLDEEMIKKREDEINNNSFF